MMSESFKRVALGAYLATVAVSLVVVILILWPEVDATGGWTQGLSLQLGGETKVAFVSVSDDVRLLLLVACVGALGACVHAATSFASYTGNDELRFSWSWWYLLRPVIGTALALVFYFAARGGFLAVGTNADDVSLYGMVALAGLVGMFSKQATDKLNELFESLFRTQKGEGDDARKGRLNTRSPVSTVMIPREKIQKVELDSQGSPNRISIKALLEHLNPTVTRIPVLSEDGRARYVIHESQIYKYVAHGLQEVPGFDISAKTLADLLSWNRVKEMVSSLGFVSTTATLADARKAMEEVEHCRDVFVTQNGRPDEPIVGWLTNVDLGKQIGQ